MPLATNLVLDVQLAPAAVALRLVAVITMKLPNKLAELDGGLYCARVEAAPSALPGRTLEAEFRIAVCAGAKHPRMPCLPNVRAA